MQATPITTSSTTVTSISLLCGYSLRETTGSAAAVVQIFDGTSTSGRLVASISLTASESVRDNLLGAGGGIQLKNAAPFVNVLSGSVEGGVWWA